MGDEIFSTMEAARFLGVLPRTMEGWRLRSEGPKYLRYNRSQIRYRRADLEEFQRRRTVVPADDMAVA
jgi:hypothetical protein